MQMYTLSGGGAPTGVPPAEARRKPVPLSRLVDRSPALYAKMLRCQSSTSPSLSHPHPAPPASSLPLMRGYKEAVEATRGRENLGWDSRGSEQRIGNASQYMRPISATGVSSRPLSAGSVNSLSWHSACTDSSGSGGGGACGRLVARLVANDPTLRTVCVTHLLVWTRALLKALCAALVTNSTVVSLTITPSAYARIKQLEREEREEVKEGGATQFGNSMVSPLWSGLLQSCMHLPLRCLQVTRLGVLQSWADAEAIVALATHLCGVECCGEVQVLGKDICVSSHSPRRPTSRPRRSHTLTASQQEEATAACDEKATKAAVMNGGRDGAVGVDIVSQNSFYKEADLRVLDFSGTKGIFSLPAPAASSVNGQLARRLSRALFSPLSTVRVADLSECGIGDGPALAALLSVFLEQGQHVQRPCSAAAASSLTGESLNAASTTTAAPSTQLSVLRLRWNGFTSCSATTELLAACLPHLSAKAASCMEVPSYSASSLTTRTPSPHLPSAPSSGVTTSGIGDKARSQTHAYASSVPREQPVKGWPSSRPYDITAASSTTSRVTRLSVAGQRACDACEAYPGHGSQRLPPRGDVAPVPFRLDLTGNALSPTLYEGTPQMWEPVLRAPH